MTLLLALLLAQPEPPPRPPSAREVVKAMLEAFNRHDATAMARLYARDARLTSSDFCSPRGQADIERTYRALFEAFPDIRDDVSTIVAEGEHVAVRFTAVSKTGPLQLPIQTMLTVRDGLITEDHSVFDTGGRPCAP
jgi:uncharacterized protein (TIGR02246 family)